ncbi:hypothetical protein VTK73DRAFT_2195 [Phialemonium thermophilum]|uniref:ATP-dependent RNA helicase n=1 Tax=Phialemonium thermophilum TaxID=223376 RepID=A0ABR3Y271_9PEZI
MDILKVLTRGIKQPLNKISESANLPSAGNRPNPQFFHDDVGQTRGSKRKRNGATEEGVGDIDDSDLDYFALKKESTIGNEPKAPQIKEQHSGSKRSRRRTKLLDEEECRQILGSHRLKVTVLCHPPATATQVTKGRKSGKPTIAEKTSDRATTKDDRKQLYPQPLRSFSDLDQVYGVPTQLVENIKKQGFSVPTEVQMGSLPLLLRPKTALEKSEKSSDIDTDNGVDFMAVAPTGSGKTLSFLIPAISRVCQRKASEHDSHDLTAVVVAPTRELASQIVSEARKLAQGTGVRIHLMRKGVIPTAEDMKEAQEEDSGKVANRNDESTSDEESSSTSGDESEEGRSRKSDRGSSAAMRRVARPDILVTTPKALLNFLSGGKTGARKTLPTVVSLVLDEADVLLDPVFQKQTVGIWNACTNQRLQLTFWSATMPSSIETLITGQLFKRARQLHHGASRPLMRLIVGLKDTAVPNVTHKLIYTATEPGKLLALRQLLHPVSGADSGPPLRPPFLVFTQTIERAQALHDELKYDIPAEAGGSTRIAVLHSGLAERVRSTIMSRFRAGDVWVLITTDVLARGVDFAGVNGVVSYDVPTSAAAYVHRAGRTGRAGREGGVAVTFYTKDDIPFVRSVANVIAMSEKQAARGGDGSSNGVQKWLLDALPKVAKEDKRRLKARGVEVRRTGSGSKKAAISTKSSWERRKENNRQGAIEASKRRKQEQTKEAVRGHDDEWSGLDD